MNASPAMVLCRVALAGLASVAARKRPALRPVAVALWALAGLDVARLATLPAGVDRMIWIVWPGVSAALSWRAWRRSWGPTTFFPTWALVCVMPPELSPDAWHVARWLPYLLSPAVSLWAWWGKEADADRQAGRCAAILAWSGLVDIAVGALAREPYRLSVAHAVSVVTWAALVVILLRREGPVEDNT